MTENEKYVKILADVFAAGRKPLTFCDLQYATGIDTFALMAALGSMLAEGRVESFVEEGTQFFKLDG